MSADEITLPPPATQRSRSMTQRAPGSQHSTLRRPSNPRHASSTSRVSNPLRSGTPAETASRTASLRSRISKSVKSARTGGSSDEELDELDDELDASDDGAPEPSRGLSSLVQNLQEASGASLRQRDIEAAVRKRVREKKQRMRQRKAERHDMSSDEPTEFTRWRADQVAGDTNATEAAHHRRRRKRDEAVRRAHEATGLPTVPETEKRNGPPSSKGKQSPPPASSRRQSSRPPSTARQPSNGDFKDAHPRDRYARFDQNLNEPFLPPTEDETKGIAARIIGPVWNKLTGYERPATMSMNVATPGTGSPEDNRNSMSAITALITTTGNIIGAASPTLGAIGPAWEGQDTTAGHGHRRIARYGRREAVEDSEARDALQAQFEHNRAIERRMERAARRAAKRQGRKIEAAADLSSASSQDHQSSSDDSDDDGDDKPGTADQIAQEDANGVVQREGDGSGGKEGAGKVPPPQETTIPDMDSTTDAVSDDTSDGEPDLEKGQGPRSNQYAGWIGSKRGERQQQEIFITRHRESHAQSRDFIVRLANALMLFGAPTHRIEGQLESAARVLELDAHFFYLPGIMVMSFSKPEQETSETAFLRCSGELDVQSLRKVHVVARGVMHDHISTGEGARRLKRITGAPPRHAVWQRIVIIAACSFFASSVVFEGSFIDMWASAILGGLMGTCQHTLAAWNPLFSNCFEIAMAFFISFLAKALSASGFFCYASLTSAGIVMILPGYILLTATLELASKVIVPGSIRLVFGVILSLFLGTGISLGSKVYVLIDPIGAQKASSVAASSSSGNVVCARSGDEPWYQSPISPYFLFITLPGFAISLALWTKARLKTKQSAATFVIACFSYASYYFAQQVVASEPAVTSAIGAGVVGLLGSLWSRIARGTAFTTQSAAVLLLVPNGLAAAGGIVMSSTSGTAAFEEGAEVALRQIQTSVGITIGLFVASLLTYLGSRKKRGTILSY